MQHADGASLNSAANDMAVASTLQPAAKVQITDGGKQVVASTPQTYDSKPAGAADSVEASVVRMKPGFATNMPPQLQDS